MNFCIKVTIMRTGDPKGPPPVTTKIFMDPVHFTAESWVDAEQKVKTTIDALSFRSKSEPEQTCSRCDGAGATKVAVASGYGGGCLVTDTCPKCGGTGKVNMHNPAKGRLAYCPIQCPVCKGTGMVSKTKEDKA